MDETTILEQELVDNFRGVFHLKYGPLLICRPTPAVERKISEERRKVYHNDLRNPDILTSEQVLELLKPRGIWSEEHNERLEKLTAESAQLMARLTALGFETPSKLYVDILKVHKKLETSFPEMSPEVSLALERIFNIGTPLETEDLMLLREAATNSDMHELIEKTEILLLQADLSREFSEVKTNLSKLMETHNRYFRDTIEARAIQAERMARIFYCFRNGDDKPLWESLDKMWDEDPDNIAWLSAQLYYFEYGITDEHARALEVHGFMGRVVVTPNSSESSHDHPESNLDGEPQENEPQSSLDVAIPTS